MAPESKSEGPVSPETSRTPQACLPKLAEFSGCCTQSHPIVKPLPPRGSLPSWQGSPQPCSLLMLRAVCADPLPGILCPLLHPAPPR